MMAYSKLEVYNSDAMSLETELRFVPAQGRAQLCNILGANTETWKSFMSKIPASRTDGRPMYSQEDIQTIENVSSGNNAVDTLLDEWGTTGRKRPTLQDLANILRADEEFTRALYCVATDILNFNDIDEIPYSAAEADPILLNGLPLEFESLASTNHTMMTHLDEEKFEANVQNDLATTECPFSIGADVPRLNYSYLCNITSNFSEIPLTRPGAGSWLGQGSFGSVFHGTMHGQLGIDGPVAVKRLNSDTDRLDSMFNAEIECMRYAVHMNILQLLAYSNDGAYLCLVYEYMENGNLADRLQLKSHSSPLTALQRLHIAVGAAEGLTYLHNHSHEKSLVHRDVKPENILLDNDLTPKLSDFGLVRLTGAGDFDRSVDQTSIMTGTPIYMAPEAFRGEISDKLDVYSFGVVLLEVLTSIPAIGDPRTQGNRLQSHWEDLEDPEALVDPVFLLEDRSISYKGWADIVDQCLEVQRKKRPNMEKVKDLLIGLDPVSIC